MQELNMALSNLDRSKSPEPDNIHGQMISRLSDWEKKSLLEIFNLSWRLRRLPHDWKKSLIIPIRKSSKKASDPESFRPIALTNFSCSAKVSRKAQSSAPCSFPYTLRALRKSSLEGVRWGFSLMISSSGTLTLTSSI
ncbi:putative RNA-directed DNA polymerase from transposon BS [Trichonephila clavipes]|nr:putative RNA-directed DNA polymerase from transposon BS [Trichonephila clavipes]